MTWVKRYFADLLGAYLDGVRVVAGLPLLFGALIAWEFAQHVVEIRTGFFVSKAAAHAVSLDPSRMALGWVKMILVYVGGFFAIRYLMWRDPARALRVSRREVVRYLPYVAYSLTLFALIFYAPGLVGAKHALALQVPVGFGQVLVEPLLMLWIVSAATAGAVRGPVASAKRTGRWYFWALALFFIGRLPINLAHQMLNRYAIGQPLALVGPMLALDAVVVGLLIAIIPALYVRVFRLVMETPAPEAQRGRVATASS